MNDVTSTQMQWDGEPGTTAVNAASAEFNLFERQSGLLRRRGQISAEYRTIGPRPFPQKLISVVARSI